MIIPWGQIAQVARARAKAAVERASAFTAAGEVDIANMWLIQSEQMMFAMHVAQECMKANGTPEEDAPR